MLRSKSIVGGRWLQSLFGAKTFPGLLREDTKLTMAKILKVAAAIFDYPRLAMNDGPYQKDIHVIERTSGNNSRHVCNDNSITNCAAVDDKTVMTKLYPVATLFQLHQAQLMI